MKKQFTLIVAAMAAIATIVACDKEVEVISSEVLDTGSEKVEVVSSCISGTQLSYETWIKMNLETKASGEQVVKATLKADISASMFDVKTDGFELQPVKLSYSYREDGRKTDGFVTIIDSVMVCNLDYGAFAYDQELKYQVAVYDDGISKETLPYHRFDKSLTVGDYTLNELDNVGIMEAIYERRIFIQQLKTTFGGQQYKLNNSLVLMKLVSGIENPSALEKPDYRTKTEILDMGYTDLDGCCKSWLKARQYYSDGYTRDIECSVNIGGGSNHSIMPYITLPNADIKLESYEIKKGETELGGGMNKTEWVIVYTTEVICALKYNQFNADVTFVREIPYFQDELVTYPMPSIDYSNFKVEEPEVRFVENTYTETNGYFASWYFTQSVSADYGTYTFNSSASRQIIVKN